jgi:hypothetical protein
MAKADKQEEMLTEIKAKMDATIQSIRSVVQETKHKRVEYAGADINQKTEANTEKIHQGMMQSAEEHQDAVSEYVAVPPVQGLKKRHRGRKSTAEGRGEQKKGPRGYYESRGKVTVAGKRTSRHATVAWRKRNLFRRNGTKEYCGSWRIFATARKGMDRCEGIARRGVHDGKRYGQVNVGQEIKKRRKDGNRLWKHTECNSGLRNTFLLLQLQDPDKCRQLRLRIAKRSNEIFGRKIAKQVVGTFRRLRRIRQLTLWRDRPSPKRKRKLRTEMETVM